MATIRDIVQVGVSMPERENFEKFSRELLGISGVRSVDGSVTYLRSDQFPYRIAAYTASKPALRYVGFDVGNDRELSEWEGRLASQGVQWRRGDASECNQRKVTGFIEFNDPDGHPIALSYGFEPIKDPVRNSRDLHMVGLGHVLLTVADTQRAHDFYTGVLGFRLSDWVYISEQIRLCFLRCNERHHSVAFAPCLPGKSPRLQHIMFEVESLDDVMRSYHFLRMHKAPIGMGPGRHPNCQTVHVYVQTPGGFAVELGWGHRRLNPEHQPVVYPAGTPVDIWGGDVQSSEFELG